MITACQGALRSGDVSLNGLPSLAHGLVQIGQADLDAEIIGFRLQKFLQQADGFRLAIVFQVHLRQLEEQGPGLAHYPLLNVEVGKLFKGANLFGSELGDALVNRNCLCQETVANKNLRKAFEVVDGLKRLALADIQLADGHQRDLVARLIFQNILVFGYGLGDFALIQQLLCSFNVFALVIGHAQKGTNLPPGVCPTSSPRIAAVAGRLITLLGYAIRQEKDKSTYPEPVVSRQLSPFPPKNSMAKTGRTAAGTLFPSRLRPLYPTRRLMVRAMSIPSRPSNPANGSASAMPPGSDLGARAGRRASPYSSRQAPRYAPKLPKAPIPAARA